MLHAIEYLLDPSTSIRGDMGGASGSKTCARLAGIGLLLCT
jgi:hypothetical protein